MNDSKPKEWFVEKDFEFKWFVEDIKTFQLLKRLGYSPKIIFDVGAAQGGWSWTMKQIVRNAKFFLFEPLVEAKVYQEVLEPILNNYPHSMKLHNVALGNVNGNSIIYTPHKAFSDINPLFGSSLLTPQVHGRQQTPVKVMTIDDAIKHFDLPIPQVIKIDTQGSELNVLEGATKTLPSVDVLFLECWITRGYGPQTPLLSEIIKWLEGFNFRLWDTGGVYRGFDNRVHTVDCVFVNTKTTPSRLFPEEA